MGFGFAFVLLAWVLFSLAMPKHRQAVLARTLPARTAPWLQVAAWCLLAAGLAACVAAKGASQGAIFWGALLILAAIAWVLLMTFVPKRALAASMALAFATVMVL